MLIDRSTSEEAQQIRAGILDRVRAYFASAYEQRPFRAGEDGVPVSGRVFDERVDE